MLRAMLLGQKIALVVGIFAMSGFLANAYQYKSDYPTDQLKGTHTSAILELRSSDIRNKNGPDDTSATTETAAELNAGNPQSSEVLGSQTMESNPHDKKCEKPNENSPMLDGISGILGSSDKNTC